MRSMDRIIEDAQRALAALPTGRVTPALVEQVHVAVWGGRHQLSHVASIGIEQPRTLVITPHDPTIIGDIERSLAQAELGSMPQRAAGMLRLSVPMPSDEQRERFVREAGRIAEEARIAIRGVRRDAIQQLRRKRAADDISEAHLNGRSKRIQQDTDAAVARINEIFARVVEQLRGA